MRNSILFVFCLALFSCTPHYSPKPSSYFRIDFPEREYQLFDSIYPFTFEYPVYGVLIDNRRASSETWLNINFPKYKGTIHLTHIDISAGGSFDKFIEDQQKIIYSKIAQKADAVDEFFIDVPEHDVYGILYNIGGNAASSVQFFVTDSVRNIIRGALYFSTRPNYDSLAPAINFFHQDIIHLIGSLEWKETMKKHN